MPTKKHIYAFILFTLKDCKYSALLLYKPLHLTAEKIEIVKIKLLNKIIFL